MSSIHVLSVTAIKCLLELLLTDKARRNCFREFEEDNQRCNLDRIPRALMFMYLTEVDSEYSNALIKLLPILVRKMVGPNDEKDNEKEEVSEQQGADHRGEKGYAYWQLLVFSLLRKSCVDYQIWNPTPFLRQGGFDDERYIEHFDALKLEMRQENLHQVVQPLSETAHHNLAKLVEVGPDEVVRSVQAIYDRVFEGSMGVEPARRELAEHWRHAKLLHSFFFRHHGITQPILLAAMMYCGMTSGSNPIRDSTELKEWDQGWFDIFYLIMNCAQVEKVNTLTKRGDRDVYLPAVDREDTAVSTPSNGKNKNKNKKKNKQPVAPVETGSGSETDAEDQNQAEDEEEEEEDDGEVKEVPEDLLLMLVSGALDTEAKEMNPTCAIWLSCDTPWHVCCHRSFFKTLTPLKNRMLIYEENNELTTDLYRVEGVGSVQIMVRNQTTNQFVRMVLHNVRYVPDLRMNLLSYPELESRVVFDEGSLTLVFDSAPNPDKLTLDLKVQAGDSLNIKSVVPQRYCFLDFNLPADFKRQIDCLPSEGHVRRLASQLRECEFDEQKRALYRL